MSIILDLLKMLTYREEFGEMLIFQTLKFVVVLRTEGSSTSKEDLGEIV